MHVPRRAATAAMADVVPILQLWNYVRWLRGRLDPGQRKQLTLPHSSNAARLRRGSDPQARDVMSAADGTPEATATPAPAVDAAASAASAASATPKADAATPAFGAKNAARPSRRKKASRACYHCQKAHLTCDDGVSPVLTCSTSLSAVHPQRPRRPVCRRLQEKSQVPAGRRRNSYVL